MLLADKLRILADAAKYDASCASGAAVRGAAPGTLGAVEGSGICHSYTPDGRCVSLLRVLLTNECVRDCRFCAARCRRRRARGVLRSARGRPAAGARRRARVTSHPNVASSGAPRASRLLVARLVRSPRTGGTSRRTGRVRASNDSRRRLLDCSATRDTIVAFTRSLAKPLVDRGRGHEELRALASVDASYMIRQNVHSNGGQIVDG